MSIIRFVGERKNMGHNNVGYKVRLIHNCIHKYMEAKRSENKDEVTGMQRWILVYLKNHSDRDIYQKDIEQEFNVSRATASNMLQVMERKNLITREIANSDARCKKICLTPGARRMLDRAEADVNAMEKRLLTGFSEEEEKQLQGYLDRILKNFGIDNKTDH